MRALPDRDGFVDDVERDWTHRLYVAHSRDLHRYATRRVGREIADDVIADVFRRVLEYGGRFDAERGSERAWLFGITTNVLRNHRRSETRRMAALTREVQRVPAAIDPLIDTGAQLDAKSDLRIVLDAAATLDLADYELLVLVVWEELSSAEAAEALGVQPGTVRSRLHRIRRELAASHAAAIRPSTMPSEGSQ